MNDNENLANGLNRCINETNKKKCIIFDLYIFI